MLFLKVQRLLSRQNGFLDFTNGLELPGGKIFPNSEGVLRELVGSVSGVKAVIRSGFRERVQSSISFRNGSADVARGVSLFVKVESPTSDRTKNGMTGSQSSLNAFPDLAGVNHHCHQCNGFIPGSTGTE